MRRLINDLLSFSRVATRGQPFVVVELNRIAQEVIVDLDEKISLTHGTIDVGPLPIIDADPMQIQMLFQNLIGNALKFHKPGVPPKVTVRGEILVEADASAEQTPREVCRLEVSDNGIGFEEKYQERIFNIFQRLHGRNEFEGTGIGLAICRKIAERHGGSIQAISTPGEGSTFRVTLPMHQILIEIEGSKV